MTIEKAIESDQIYMTPTPTLFGDPAWMDVKELEVGIWKEGVCFL